MVRRGAKRFCELHERSSECISGRLVQRIYAIGNGVAPLELALVDWQFTMEFPSENEKRILRMDIR